MQFREIVRPLDRSNRRNDVDREGGRGSEGVEVIHWTIGKFSEWSMASSHLGKVFKTKETERSSREMEREGARRSLRVEGMKLLELKLSASIG